MPQYEYQCPHCGSTMEEYKSVRNRDDAPECVYCSKGVKTKRILSPGTFIINGYSEANGYSKSEGAKNG